jgi:MFS family permease
MADPRGIEMNDPWFSNPGEFAALFGAIAGGVGGGLFGLVGALCGWLLPQNRGKKFVIGAMGVFCVLGICSLLAGLIALLDDQPYEIYFPPLIAGSVFALVPGFLIPLLIRLYGEMEKKRLAAEEFRKNHD